ncbi:MAG TPA: phosphoribosylformylglycinamidine cyclo-ligase [Trebonia sp.]|jgi:phosphoribosylformylglycinamidine cyclo-ligase|nr:phosphoribosylformylglycinamidine cyclo-ligase [Trebonia sp.]
MPDKQSHSVPSTYAEAGVDEEREQNAFSRVMRPWLARTQVKSPMVTSITGLSSGYFSTIMHLPPGPPLAVTTDGVGTKILLAREANRWEPVGVDCVANNVNDLICVGAVPLALLDYVATDRIDEGVLDEIARGLFLGAELAGIAIPGGEIAQIGAMLADSTGGGPMLDLVGTAIGALPPIAAPAPSAPTQAPAQPDLPAAAGKILGPQPAYRDPVDGSAVRPGDVIIGLPSSGLHSNGYSLARHALFTKGGLSLGDQVPGTGRRLADALLQPTRVYVKAAEALWAAGLTPHGLAHISGGGLLNIARLAADVSYELDALPAPAEIFSLIAQAGEIDAATMYATFNMGIGFCVVVGKADQQAALDALKGAGEDPVRIGWVTARAGRSVSIPAVGLYGKGDSFEAVRR